MELQAQSHIMIQQQLYQTQVPFHWIEQFIQCHGLQADLYDGADQFRTPALVLVISQYGLLFQMLMITDDTLTTDSTTAAGTILVKHTNSTGSVTIATAGSIA